MDSCRSVALSYCTEGYNSVILVVCIQLHVSEYVMAILAHAPMSLATLLRGDREQCICVRWITDFRGLCVRELRSDPSLVLQMRLARSLVRGSDTGR